MNYALTLEYLETDFYKEVIEAGCSRAQLGRRSRSSATPSSQHVDALDRDGQEARRQAGREAEDELPAQGTTSVVLKLAATVENLGAAAYLGQAREITEPGDPRRRALDPLGRGPPRGASTRCSARRSTPTARSRKPAAMAAGPPQVQPFIVRLTLSQKGDHDHDYTQCPAPELAEIEVQGISRGAFLIARRARRRRRLRRRRGQPVRRARRSRRARRRRRHPELRADPRVPRGRLLQGGAAKVEAQSRTSRARQADRRHEQQHVDALTKAIKGAGGKPVKAPTVELRHAFIEREGLPEARPDVRGHRRERLQRRRPADQEQGRARRGRLIVQVEARHAAAIRLQNGQMPAPNAFDPTLSKDQVLTAVKPFLA